MRTRGNSAYFFSSSCSGSKPTYKPRLLIGTLLGKWHHHHYVDDLMFCFSMMNWANMIEIIVPHGAPER